MARVELHRDAAVYGREGAALERRWAEVIRSEEHAVPDDPAHAGSDGIGEREAAVDERELEIEMRDSELSTREQSASRWNRIADRRERLAD